MAAFKAAARRGELVSVDDAEREAAYAYVGSHAFKWAQTLSASGCLQAFGRVGITAQAAGAAKQQELQALRDSYKHLLELHRLKDEDVVACLAAERTRNRQQRLLAVAGAAHSLDAGASAAAAAKEGAAADDGKPVQLGIGKAKRGRAPKDPMRGADDAVVATGNGQGHAAEDSASADGQIGPASRSDGSVKPYGSLSIPKQPTARVVVVKQVVYLDAAGQPIPTDEAGMPIMQATIAAAATEGQGKAADGIGGPSVADNIPTSKPAHAPSIARRALVPLCPELPMPRLMNRPGPGGLGYGAPWSVSPGTSHQLPPMATRVQHLELQPEAKPHRTAAVRRLARAVVPPTVLRQATDRPTALSSACDHPHGIPVWAWHGVRDATTARLTKSAVNDGVGKVVAEVPGRAHTTGPHEGGAEDNANHSTGLVQDAPGAYIDGIDYLGADNYDDTEGTGQPLDPWGELAWRLEHVSSTHTADPAHDAQGQAEQAEEHDGLDDGLPYQHDLAAGGQVGSSLDDLDGPGMEGDAARPSSTPAHQVLVEPAPTRHDDEPCLELDMGGPVGMGHDFDDSNDGEGEDDHDHDGGDQHHRDRDDRHYHNRGHDDAGGYDRGHGGADDGFGNTGGRNSGQRHHGDYSASGGRGLPQGHRHGHGHGQEVFDHDGDMHGRAARAGSYQRDHSGHTDGYRDGRHNQPRAPHSSHQYRDGHDRQGQRRYGDGEEDYHGGRTGQASYGSGSRHYADGHGDSHHYHHHHHHHTDSLGGHRGAQDVPDTHWKRPRDDEPFNTSEERYEQQGYRYGRPGPGVSSGHAADYGHRPGHGVDPRASSGSRAHEDSGSRRGYYGHHGY